MILSKTVFFPLYPVIGHCLAPVASDRYRQSINVALSGLPAADGGVGMNHRWHNETFSPLSSLMQAI